MGFNLVAAVSQLKMPSVLIAAVVRRQRVRAQARVKRKFTQALVLASNGKRSPFLVRRLTRFEHRVLIVSRRGLQHQIEGALQ